MQSLYDLRAREFGYFPARLGYTWTCKGLLEKFVCLKDQQHIFESWEEEAWVPPFACQFCTVPSAEHVLAVADEDGCVRLFNTNKNGDESLSSYWMAHSNAVFDIAWTQQDNKLLTASGDQTVAFWDVTSKEKLCVFKGHVSSVKTVNFQLGSKDVFASGSRDGHIMVWDSRCASKDGSIPSVNQIRNAHSLVDKSITQKSRRRVKQITQESSQQSVTSVLFQDDHYLISAGAADGNIKVWDLRKNYSILKSTAVPWQLFTYAGLGIRKHGFSNLCMDSSRTRLFANCMDDIIYEYNCASYTSQPVATYRGHRNATFYVKAAVSPDDQYLLSGSSDDLAYIWCLNEPTSGPVVLEGHQGEVTDVSWCPTDTTKIATLSDDNSMWIWQSDGSIPVEPATVVGKAHRRISEKVVCTESEQVVDCHSSITQSTLSTKVANQEQQVPTVTKSFKSPTYKLPTLMEWLSPKSGPKYALLKKNLKSPQKSSSPRKINLFLSPRKSSDSYGACEIQDALSPVKCGVKRKLDGAKVSNGCHMPPLKKCNYESVKSNVQSKTVFRESSDYNVVKKLFKCHEETVGWVQAVGGTPQSPTSNLPNYVLNPQPRSIYVPPSNKENSPKKIDWLTQLSQQRRNSREGGSPVTCRSRPASPSLNQQRRGSKGVSPVSSRSRPASPSLESPARKTRTILTYFSPKTQKKKD